MALTVRQPVRMQRDQGPADDGKQSERDPGTQQCQEVGPGRRGAAALGAGQGVDNAAEQDRLGELGCRKRQVGDGQCPGEPGFVAPMATLTMAFAGDCPGAGAKRPGATSTI